MLCLGRVFLCVSPRPCSRGCSWISRALCVEELESVKNCPSYEGRPEDVYEGYRCWFDALSDWTQNTEAGNLLRVLKFVGTYDGRKIDRGRLLTALP